MQVHVRDMQMDDAGEQRQRGQAESDEETDEVESIQVMTASSVYGLRRRV